MIGTAYWYMHTDQWRTDGYSADALTSPLSDRTAWTACTPPTRIAQSARLGWMPFYPQFDRNPLDLADEAEAAVAAGEAATDTAGYVADALKTGTLNPAIEDVDAPENWPRTLVLWRSNLFGSSAKGNEYFLQAPAGHPLQRPGPETTPSGLTPKDVKWHERGAGGQARPAGLAPTSG